MGSSETIFAAAAPVRQPECPGCEPVERPDKNFPERPAPSREPQPLRSPTETPVLPESHPEGTPVERPE